MKIFYWKAAKGNFGDDLNEWLWDFLLPGWQGWDEDTTLVGVGTILNSNHFKVGQPGRLLVVGSGVGNGPPPDISEPGKWDIRCLRGTRSARALNLPEDIGIIDPAIMVSDMPEFQGLQKQGKPILIPHISSIDNFDWVGICAKSGVDFVSPREESHLVIKRIAQAPLVIAESMHAAIIADALRTPWVAVQISSTFNGRKWLDWSESLKIDLQIKPLFPAIKRLEALLGKSRGAAAAPIPKAAATGTPPSASRRQVSLRRKLRLSVEAMLATRALKQALGMPPSLSAQDVLNDQKARFRAVLAQISQDYRA